MVEQGICHVCAQNKECLVSNQGWICRECFHGMAKNPVTKSKVIVPPPNPEMKVFVMMEGPGYGTFITIDGTLYTYEKREVADYALSELGKSADVSGIDIREVRVVEPFLYAMKTPNIRMLAVKDFKERLAEKQ
jgi:hypothetical protein